MSGSEIVDQIEDYTDWRPSPGSIYPMLSDMQAHNYIQPYEDQNPLMKRFELTELGLKAAEEMMKHDSSMRNRQRSMRKIYWRLHLGVSEELYNSIGGLLNSLENVYVKVNGNPDSDRILGCILNNAVSKIKEIDG
jgi:DNA-binding PadR family transcriptional regulator